MKTRILLRIGVSVAGFSALAAAALPRASGTVQAGENDIGGVVSGPKGPEAGVWVIAETNGLPTKFVRIVVTDDQGRYRFLTIRPGAYPWPNHRNAWRPNHIHFSYFGPAFATRLITQMYFPDDPLLAYDPIYNSVPTAARKRLQASFDMATTRPEWALAYKFDVVLRGRNATPMEN